MHFFRNYASYALRADLCDFAFNLVHNSGSPEMASHTLSIGQVPFTLLFCIELLRSFH